MDDKPLIDIDNKKEQKPDLNITIDKVTPDLSVTAPEFDTVTESFEPTQIKETQPIKQESTILSGEDLAEIKEQLKAQIFDELKDDHKRATEEAKFRRLAEDDEYARYVEKMKLSPDPWVDIIGWVRTDEGVKIELEWNDAFVDYLRGSGIKGADEDQIVQKWVTLLLRDMADKMEERFGSDYE